MAYLENGDISTKLVYKIKPTNSNPLDILEKVFGEVLVVEQKSRHPNWGSSSYYIPGEPSLHEAQFYLWGEEGHPYRALVISLGLGDHSNCHYEPEYNEERDEGPTVLEKLTKSIEQALESSGVVVSEQLTLSSKTSSNSQLAFA